MFTCTRCQSSREGLVELMAAHTLYGCPGTRENGLVIFSDPTAPALVVDTLPTDQVIEALTKAIHNEKCRRVRAKGEDYPAWEDFSDRQSARSLKNFQRSSVRAGLKDLLALGWRLVPVQATVEMSSPISADTSSRVYAAMVGAAPDPLVAEEETE